VLFGKQGISVELIDLRSPVPYDWERAAESIKKPTASLVAHEDSVSYGYGAETRESPMSFFEF